MPFLRMCEKVTCVCSVSEFVLFPILKDLLAEFPIDRMKRSKRSSSGIYLVIHLSLNLLCVCIRDILFSAVFIKVQKYSKKNKHLYYLFNYETVLQTDLEMNALAIVLSAT